MVSCAYLAFTEASRSGRIVAIRDSARIGRNDSNDIVLDSNSVSSSHAVLMRDAAGMLLLNLESATGTLVNGTPIQPDEPVQLANGDVLQFGGVLARYIAPTDQWNRCSC